MSHAGPEPTLAVVGLLALAAAVLTLTALPAAGLDAASGGNAPAAPATTQDGGVTVLRGNASLFGAADGAADLRRARGDGRLRESDRLVAGDILVLRVRSAAFVDAIATSEGATATDRFFSLRARTDYGLAVVERAVSVSQRPTELWLNRTTTRVLTDRGNDTAWVLIDTGRTATILEDETASDDPEVVERSLAAYEFTAGVVVAGEGDDGARSFAATGAFVPRSLGVTATGGGLRLVDDQGTVSANATRVRLSGTTTLLPGTRLRVRAARPNGSVLANATVRTRPAGNRSQGLAVSRFETALDLSALAAEDRLTLVVTDGDRTVRRWRLFVGRAPRIETASARLVEEGDREGQIALTVGLQVPEQGIVVVAGSDAVVRVPEGRPVTRTLYLNRSVADESGDVAVTVLWDVDRDGVLSGPDRGFEGADGTTLDRVLPVEGLATEPTTDPTTTAPPPTLADRESSPTPGFGVTTVALAAILGTVALLWRRRSGR